VVRMQHAFICNQPSLFPDIPIFIGMGGAPTWSKDISGRIDKSLSDNQPIYYISGDFRFGNTIIADGIDIECATKEYINVNGNYLSDLNDLKMYGFYLRGMDSLVAKFRTLKIIPWTLLMRRAQNISNGRHINELGDYAHPIYDEKNLIEKYSSYSYTKCLSISPKVLSQFYIDNDLHPSTLGYMFLSRCIGNDDPYQSIHYVVKHLNKCIKKFLLDLDIHKKINIVGCSTAFSTFKKVLPFEYGLDNLITINKELSNNDISINLLSLEETSKANFKISQSGEINIPWDYLGFMEISKRHPDLKRLKPEAEYFNYFSFSEFYSAFKVNDFFDIGEKLTPTLKGTLFILSMASKLSENKKVEIINEAINDIFHLKEESESMFIKIKSFFKGRH